MVPLPINGEVVQFTSPYIGVFALHLHSPPRFARRVIIDRYALPAGADPNQCAPGDRTWCGGTWTRQVSCPLTCIFPADFPQPSRKSRLHPKCRFHRWCAQTSSLLFSTADLNLVWISPVSQNYEGPTTPYGDPYHGYWIADATQLNSRFGTSDDLKDLSDELHRRGM